MKVYVCTGRIKDDRIGVVNSRDRVTSANKSTLAHQHITTGVHWATALWVFDCLTFKSQIASFIIKKSECI